MSSNKENQYAERYADFVLKYRWGIIVFLLPRW